MLLLLLVEENNISLCEYDVFLLVTQADRLTEKHHIHFNHQA